MMFKLFLFLVSLVFVGCGGEPKPIKVDNKQLSSVVKSILPKQKTKIVWDSDSKVYISDSEYDKAMIKYVESKYPDKVKNYKWNLKQKEIKRQKEIVIQKKEKLKRQIELEKQKNLIINALIWQDNKEARTIKKDWKGAKNYCQNLSFIGYSDWRLPNIDELKNLYKHKDKLKNYTYYDYWSSTTYVNDHSYAWYIRFNNGVSTNSYKMLSKYVRCVRVGQ